MDLEISSKLVARIAVGDAVAGSVANLSVDLVRAWAGAASVFFGVSDA